MVPSGFNTQPPEGGWGVAIHAGQAAWVSTHSRLKAAGTTDTGFAAPLVVSTHSRLKAAGHSFYRCNLSDQSFNTQPPEGGWAGAGRPSLNRAVSTHSRPKAAGICLFGLPRRHRCFNTQPPEGGWRVWYIPKKNRKLFQHTAARRRLGWATATVSRKRWFQHTAARRRLDQH